MKRRSNHGNELKKTYLKVPNSLIDSKLNPARIFLTSFAFEYISEMLKGSKNILVAKDIDFKKCNVCDWDVKIGLPCLHQLSSFEEISQIRVLIMDRWKKKFI